MLLRRSLNFSKSQQWSSIPSLLLSRFSTVDESTEASQATLLTSSDSSLSNNLSSSSRPSSSPKVSKPTQPPQKRKILPPPGNDWESYLMARVQEHYKPKRKRIHEFFPNITLTGMKGGVETVKGTKNKVVRFKVQRHVSKPDIKRYLETVYGVRVLKVNTLIYAPKLARSKNGPIKKRHGYKKAYVTFADDVKPVEGELVANK